MNLCVPKFGNIFSVVALFTKGTSYDFTECTMNYPMKHINISLNTTVILFVFFILLVIKQAFQNYAFSTVYLLYGWLTASLSQTEERGSKVFGDKSTKN